MKVAVKSFKSEMSAMNCREMGLEKETESWDLYQAASAEGRMMYQLNHPNILTLLGVTFNPLQLLLELAPKGDLRGSIRQFQKAGQRLSRRTIKATLIQVCMYVCIIMFFEEVLYKRERGLATVQFFILCMLVVAYNYIDT